VIQFVVGYPMFADHHRLRLKFGVEREKLLVDHVPVIAGAVIRVLVGVEQPHFEQRHDAQGFLGEGGGGGEY
jgi:hypothetical protein